MQRPSSHSIIAAMEHQHWAVCRAVITGPTSKLGGKKLAYVHGTQPVNNYGT